MTFLTHKNATVNHHAATFIYLGKDCQCTAIRRNVWLLLEGKRKRDQKHGNARGETGFRITIIMMQEIRSEEE